MSEGKQDFSRNPIVWMLGLGAAILAAGALFFSSAKDFKEKYQDFASGPPPLVLPSSTVDYKGSGNTTVKACEPTRAALAAQHPGYDISVVDSDPPKDKDWKGEVTYHFLCQFDATRHA